MAITFIPFDGWQPGGGNFGEGWEVANNVYPAFGSEARPWRAFTPMAGTVADGPMTGSYTHVWASGIGGAYTGDAQTIFTGSPNQLYSVNPTTGVFTTLSRGGGYAAAGTPAGWRFASVGNDIFATNWLDAAQRRANNAGNFANGFTSTFLPVPRFMATFREHLLVANLNNAGRFQDELAWSDADNALNFDPPTGTSTSIAGSKRLTSIPGQITGLLGGQYGLAFKATGIYYLEATGTVQVLRPDILSDAVGTRFPSSIIRTRHGVFFLGPDGFYQISGLSAPVKISPPGVDRHLLKTTFSVPPASSAAWEEDTQAEAFSFSGLPLIGWGWRDNMIGIGSEHVILYDPLQQRWGYGDMNPAFTGALFQRPRGTSLMDTVGGFTWDGINSSVAFYEGAGGLGFQEIQVSLRFRPANFEQSTHGQSVITGVMPMFSGTSAGELGASALTPTVSIQAALQPFQAGSTLESSPPAQRDDFGWYSTQSAGRLFLVRLSMTAQEFETFHGLWIKQEALT